MHGQPLLERTIDTAKFIYLYRGPSTERTSEQGAEREAAFAAWTEKLGPALIDVGSPFGASGSVRDGGSEGAADDLIGYSIVETDDLAGAKAFTDGLPFLSNGEGKCTVEIFELLPLHRKYAARIRLGDRAYRSPAAGIGGYSLRGRAFRSSVAGIRGCRQELPATSCGMSAGWGVVTTADGQMFGNAVAVADLPRSVPSFSRLERSAATGRDHQVAKEEGESSGEKADGEPRHDSRQIYPCGEADLRVRDRRS